MATKTSVGLIELGSIAGGFQVTDAMLKAADVELVLARTICSGKYMVMVKGDTAAVEAAVQEGRRKGDFSVIDTFMIPNVHASIFPAMSGVSQPSTNDMCMAFRQRFAVRLAPPPCNTLPE